MCMIGYEDDPDVPGGGYFLVRNSWGTGWGSKSPIAAGHARIPYAYITQYGRSAYSAYLRNDRSEPAEKSGFFARLWSWLKNLFG